MPRSSGMPTRGWRGRSWRACAASRGSSSATTNPTATRCAATLSIGTPPRAGWRRPCSRCARTSSPARTMRAPGDGAWRGSSRRSSPIRRCAPCSATLPGPPPRPERARAATGSRPSACVGGRDWSVCRMPILSVRHVTTYRYRRPVAFGEHRIMFRPRDSYDQRLIEAAIAITPEPASLRWVHDVFGNCVAVARFAERAAELRFECRIRLDHTPVNALDFQLEDYARRYPFTYGAEDMPDLARSIERQYVDPNREIDGWVQRFLDRGGTADTQALLAAIAKTIQREFTSMWGAPKKASKAR